MDLVFGAEVKGFTTGVTEDHGGNPRVIKVDLFDAFH
jgi:hypothetical protein